MRYKQLLDACGQDLEAVRDLVQREKLDYLLIDNALRQAEDISVDEAFFNDNFQLVAWFPDLGDIMIYDLNSHP